MATNDASNRSWRAILQGAAAVAIIAILSALLEWLEAGDFSLRTLGVSSATAVLIAVLAYLHRALIDPSRLPSAVPPADPGWPASYEGTLGEHRGDPGRVGFTTPSPPEKPKPYRGPSRDRSTPGKARIRERRGGLGLWLESDPNDVFDED